MTNHTPVSLGQACYVAYGAARDFRTWDDRRMPEWRELPPPIQAAWIAAAEAIWNAAIDAGPWR